MMTKSSAVTATDPHVSIIGHITEHELRAKLSRTDMANGFANRFLFALVKRSKLLPFGGSLSLEEINKLGERFKKIVDKTLTVGSVEMTMTEDAAKKWEVEYEELSVPRSAMLGEITARAEAQTLRLALIYALLDCKAQIDLPHLEAATALWEYCEASAARIFGNIVGDPIADTILAALKEADKVSPRRKSTIT
jgi:hypothetical protein